jgi:hypothetical protein
MTGLHEIVEQFKLWANFGTCRIIINPVLITPLRINHGGLEHQVGLKVITLESYSTLWYKVIQHTDVFMKHQSYFKFPFRHIHTFRVRRLDHSHIFCGILGQYHPMVYCSPQYQGQTF